MTAALVPEHSVGTAERGALAHGVLLVPREGEARFRLTGSGRVACLQGLVTCDVAKPGDGARLFGALLTNKGMIVAPLWISRLADAIVVELPASAAPAVHEVFTRSLPPRLCRAEDLTPTTIALGLYGPRAGELLAKVVGPLPLDGAIAWPYASGTVWLAPATARGAPGWDVVVGTHLARALSDDLLANGATPGSAAALEAARIVGGIPRLGAEIDERTLPQEVRLEELGALSYTKGCYLGQETVARLHFRGHTNRRLAAFTLDAEPASLPLDTQQAGRSVGRLTSAAWHPGLGRWFALGVVRHDLEAGAVLGVTGGTATVLEDPWRAA